MYKKAHDVEFDEAKEWPTSGLTKFVLAGLPCAWRKWWGSRARMILATPPPLDLGFKGWGTGKNSYRKLFGFLDHEEDVIYCVQR